MTILTRTLIESPFMGHHADPVIRAALNLRNIVYARACVRDCLHRHEAPFCSHLLYTQDSVLDDDIPTERMLGIEAGLTWGLVADRTAIYTDLGISSGMQQGRDHAIAHHRPIEERTLLGWAHVAALDTATAIHAFLESLRDRHA